MGGGGKRERKKLALFVRYTRWKQYKCASTDEWINKMWKVNTPQYFSAIKRTELLIHVTIWMNLENIKASERSQTQKAAHCMIQLYKMSRIGKSIETESRLVVARGWSLRKWGGPDNSIGFL